MKLKTARGLGALALVLSAVTLGASDQPAFAAGSCPNNHFSNKDGQIWHNGFASNHVAIRNGNGGGCAIVGYGDVTDTTQVHCFTPNGDWLWVHLKDLTTGVSGWVRIDHLHYGSERGC